MTLRFARRAARCVNTSTGAKQELWTDGQSWRSSEALIHSERTRCRPSSPAACGVRAPGLLWPGGRSGACLRAGKLGHHVADASRCGTADGRVRLAVRRESATADPLVGGHHRLVQSIKVGQIHDGPTRHGLADHTHIPKVVEDYSCGCAAAKICPMWSGSKKAAAETVPAMTPTNSSIAAWLPASAPKSCCISAGGGSSVANSVVSP
jgi:hypothetical protein